MDFNTGGTWLWVGQWTLPCTSRSLPSRSCKKHIPYADNDKIEEREEPNFNDSRNSNPKVDESQLESDYFEQDQDKDLDPYGLFKHDSTSSESDKCL